MIQLVDDGYHMAKAHEIGTSSIKKVSFDLHINTVFLIIFKTT